MSDVPTEPMVGVHYAISIYFRCWVADTATVILRRRDGESPPADVTIECNPDLRCRFTLWFITFDKPGRHVLSVEMDPDNVFAEVDELNNVASVALMVGSDESLSH